MRDGVVRDGEVRDRQVTVTAGREKQEDETNDP